MHITAGRYKKQPIGCAFLAVLMAVLPSLAAGCRVTGNTEANCSKQAIALIDPVVSAKAIFRQLAMLGDVGPLFDDGRSKIMVRLGF